MLPTTQQHDMNPNPLGSSSKGKGSKSQSCNKQQVVLIDAESPQRPCDIVHLTDEGMPPAAALPAVSTQTWGTSCGYNVNPFVSTALVSPQGPCQAELPLIGTSAPRGTTLQDTYATTGYEPKDAQRDSTAVHGTTGLITTGYEPKAAASVQYGRPPSVCKRTYDYLGDSMGLTERYSIATPRDPTRRSAASTG